MCRGHVSRSGGVAAVPRRGKAETVRIELSPVELFGLCGVLAVALQNEPESDSVVRELERPDLDVAVFTARKFVEPGGQEIGQAVAETGARAPDLGLDVRASVVEAVKYGVPRLVLSPVGVVIEGPAARSSDIREELSALVPSDRVGDVVRFSRDRYQRGDGHETNRSGLKPGYDDEPS